MRRFDDQVAFITGAARGIGRATALRLAAEGATVIVADVDPEAADATAAELTDTGASAMAVACDVTDVADVRAAIAATADRYGRLDILVNNVGIAGPGRFAELDDADWDRQVNPTLVGAARCIQAALPHLLVSPGGGAVVSISSVNGMAAWGGVPYSAAKAGLINMTQNLSVEYSPQTRGAAGAESGWVRFNVVAPGTIRTRAWTENGPEQAARLERLNGIYPMGRVGEPEDIAAAVAFLVSADAAWITGITMPVDGGIMAGPMVFRSWRSGGPLDRSGRSEEPRSVT